MKRTFLLAILVVAGCSSSSKPDPAKATPSSEPSTNSLGAKNSGGTAENNPPATPETAKTGEVKKEETKPDAPAPKIDEIAADLKHDAFLYYGLENAKPINYVLKVKGQPKEIRGSQSFTLKSVKDGKAIFELNRTGDLSVMGTTELSLEKDGLYMTSSLGTPSGVHSLEMPSKLKDGASWDDHTDISANNQTMKFDNTVKVVGRQKVTTSVGSYGDALLVVSNGKGVVNGAKTMMQTKTWYVKRRGPVKVVVVQTPEKGAPNSFTLEETK